MEPRKRRVRKHTKSNALQAAPSLLLNKDESNIIYKESSHKTVLTALKNHSYTDFKVQIDDRIFDCHLILLQCHAEYFRNKHYTENKHVSIKLPSNQVSCKAFSMLYDWMIEENPTVARDGITELYNASIFLKISELEEQCFQYLNNANEFSENKAFDLFIEAKDFDLEKLKTLMVQRIQKYFLVAISTPDYLQLSVRDICILLKSSRICVHTEVQVLMAATLWLLHDWDNRKRHLREVMNCIRFGLITPYEILAFNSRTLDQCEPALRTVMNDDEIQKMLSDGLTYITLTYQCPQMKPFFKDRCKLDKVEERLWIKDESFLKKTINPNEECVSYAFFLKFINTLKEPENGIEPWKKFETHPFSPIESLALYRSFVEKHRNQFTEGTKQQFENNSNSSECHINDRKSKNALVDSSSFVQHLLKSEANQNIGVKSKSGIIHNADKMKSKDFQLISNQKNNGDTLNDKKTIKDSRVDKTFVENVENNANHEYTLSAKSSKSSVSTSSHKSEKEQSIEMPEVIYQNLELSKRESENLELSKKESKNYETPEINLNPAESVIEQESGKNLGNDDEDDLNKKSPVLKKMESPIKMLTNQHSALSESYSEKDISKWVGEEQRFQTSQTSRMSPDLSTNQLHVKSNTDDWSQRYFVNPNFRTKSNTGNGHEIRKNSINDQEHILLANKNFELYNLQSEQLKSPLMKTIQNQQKINQDNYKNYDWSQACRECEMNSTNYEDLKKLQSDGKYETSIETRSESLEQYSDKESPSLSRTQTEQRNKLNSSPIIDSFSTVDQKETKPMRNRKDISNQPVYFVNPSYALLNSSTNMSADNGSTKNLRHDLSYSDSHKLSYTEKQKTPRLRLEHKYNKATQSPRMSSNSRTNDQEDSRNFINQTLEEEEEEEVADNEELNKSSFRSPKCRIIPSIRRNYYQENPESYYKRANTPFANKNNRNQENWRDRKCGDEKHSNDIYQYGYAEYEKDSTPYNRYQHQQEQQRNQFNYGHRKDQNRHF